jgi:carbamoyl-phosphate synthase large subunit
MSIGKNQTIRVLLPSGGGINSLPLIRYLKSIKTYNFEIFVTDIQSDSPIKNFVQKYFVSPKANSEEYLDFMTEICSNNKISVIIPGINIDSKFFAQNKAHFDSIGSQSTVSSEKSVKSCIDKTLCFEILKANGIDVPTFYEVKSINDFIEAARELGFPNKPICMKPSRYPDGSGKGFRIIDPVFNVSRNLFWASTSDLYYVRYEDVLRAMEEEVDFPALLIMEYLPYEEFSVYCLCENGNSHYIIQNLRQKLVLMNSAQAEIVNNLEIELISRKICELFGFDYNINIQLKMSQNHIPKVVEINPRIAGSVLLPVAAGIDLPCFSILMALGMDFPKNIPIKYGTILRRYWDVVFEYKGEMFYVG